MKRYSVTSEPEEDSLGSMVYYKDVVNLLKRVHWFFKDAEVFLAYTRGKLRPAQKNLINEIEKMLMEAHQKEEKK